MWKKVRRKPSRPLKKAHLRRCARLPRSDVLLKYACARRFLARLASETFLSGLKAGFLNDFAGESFRQRVMGLGLGVLSQIGLGKARISTVCLLAGVALLIFGVSPVYGWFWRSDMVEQPSVKPQEAPRPLPANSIPREGKEPSMDRVEAGKKLRNPVEQSSAVLENGKNLYGIYCALCHGDDAKGGGPVSGKFVPPPDLTLAVFRERPDGFLYQTITDGGPLMPGQGDALRPRERWEIVLYLRRLQGVDK